ncbi:MAG: hypothetical protein ACLP66_01420 [Polyangia bacterium]
MRTEQRHMLHTSAEQNIGNGIQALQPQAGGATVIPQTNPERILMLSGPSDAGQTTSVVLTASRIVPGLSNSAPGFPGPITGIIEFGNGGQFTRVEVDIPIGPFAGTLLAAAPATEPQDGGVIVTVPTGVLRVYARYDNQLIQAPIGLPPQSMAQIASQPFIGPGGPANNAGTIIPAEPVQVKAMAAYFSRHTSKVYRTHYCFIADNSTGAQTSIYPFDTFCVPAFARAVKVMRQPMTTALTVILADNANHQMDQISIAANASSPVIPLFGTETNITVAGVSPLTDKVTFLALSYEIGI